MGHALLVLASIDRAGDHAVVVAVVAVIALVGWLVQRLRHRDPGA